jgi:hypothetical protein
MGVPIDLDHKTGGWAVEVQRIFSERVLTAELPAVRPLPQNLPKAEFRRGGRTP